MQVRCSWDIDPTTSGIVSLPCRASADLSYSIFFDEMGSGGWRDPCMICALKDAKEGQRRFDAKTKQKSRIAIRKVMFIPLVFLVQHLKK